jgi:DNA (cytosine-5)-methyltransferase 1
MKTVDLFAGCGGMSLGFKRAGYDLALAVDNWEAALRCYQANLKDPYLLLDLSEPDVAVREIRRRVPKAEVVIGGPPCQDFSHAGPRREGARADLTESFARIVAALRPLAYVMENVDRTARSSAYQRARALLKEAGYGVTEAVLDASYYGVPQRRKRFFSIGVLGEVDGFLTLHLMEMREDRPLTLREYMGEELNLEYYYRHPRNYNRRGIYSVDEPAPTVRGVNRPVPKGYPGHPADPVPPFEGLRPLTTEERGRAQTFPKGWKWVGSKSEVEQMIGNAVPPELARRVALALKEFLREKGLWTGPEALEEPLVAKGGQPWSMSE